MAEDFGVEDRGHFYDPVGALRDVVVNHLMQVVARGRDGGAVGRRPGHAQGRACSPSSARSQTADPAHYVRGQYDGYLRDRRRRRRLDDRDVRRAAPRDRQLALVGRAVLHPHRQALPVTQTELRLVFKQPPRLGFERVDDRHGAEPARGQARPVDRRAARRSTRTAPTSQGAEPITLDMEFAEEGGEGATPYEVLLHAAMVGDSTRFTRQDGVEETWRIMQPLLDSPPPVHPYAPGSWGPEAADDARRAATAAGTGPWVATEA